MPTADDIRVKCDVCAHPSTCPFSHLGERDLQGITETMNALYYEKEQIIWQEGVYRSGCFILCSGSADLIVRNIEGKRRIIMSLHAGDIVPCLDGARMGDPTHQFATQVESTSPVLVRYVPSESFGYLMIRYPSVAVKVIEKFSVTVLQLIREVGVSSYCDVQTRLVRVLRYLRETGQPLPSQQVIAELVGASREAINKALHSLVHEKILAIQNHEIEVLDERRLQQLRQ